MSTKKKCRLKCRLKKCRLWGGKCRNVTKKNVDDGDASWQGQKDVPAGFDPGAGTRGRGASAPGKAREAAEGGFLGGGDACPDG
jgi:hypothetical protein